MKKLIPKNACITFTYRSPLTRKITNLFKNTNINIAYRSSTAAYKQLQITQNTTRQIKKLVSIKLNAKLAINIMWDNPFDRSNYVFESI
jgi:glycine cleavage system regulatory protein